MKKLFLVLSLMLFCSSQSFAACDNVDYSTKCAPKAYDLCSKGGQITSRVTGMTFLSEKIAQCIIKKELKKATKENFNVEMKSYSAKDLLSGRFKSLKFSGKNLDIDGAYISSLEAKTVCDFNYIDINKKTKNIKFKENMVMNYTIEISNKDLQKTINSTDYIKNLNKIKLSSMGITFFKLEGANVEIKNNKLYFTVRVISPISAKPIPICVRSDVKVEDGNIVLTKIDLVNIYTVLDLSKVTYLLNALNPLTFTTDILHNPNSKMKIQTVDIIGDRIYIKGNIFIPKNTTK